MKFSSSVKIYKNVHLGKSVTIEPGVIIGLPPFGRKNGELKTIIGDNAYIRAYTIIYAGVQIGNNFQTGPSVLIREDNIIGDDVVVWHNSTLNPENKIGDGSRIHAGCFLEKVILGQNVFVGPHVTFTDDPHPIIPLDFRNCWQGATIADNAVVGGNSTILPHVKIGKQAVIGAGAVVVKDVPAGKVAVGNPAKVIKNITEIICKKSGKEHNPYGKIKI